MKIYLLLEKYNNFWSYLVQETIQIWCYFSFIYLLLLFEFHQTSQKFNALEYLFIYQWWYEMRYRTLQFPSSHRNKFIDIKVILSIEID
jgi:hypothetical protein